MAIPSLVQGIIEAEDGKVFELETPKGLAWLESVGSFRFEPSGDSKPYTVRKEAGIYWYGCRKIAGKVRKKYIGKSSEVSVAKLEEIAAALEIPLTQRVVQVTEVAQEVAQNIQVAEKVTEVAQDRLTALELEVANLRKALKALQEALSEKFELDNSEELPKVDSEVAEELQNELGSLKTENEYLRQKLADSRDTIETLNWGTESLNEQLEVAQAENQRLQNDLGNSQTEVTELRLQLGQERADREEIENELSELKQKSAAARELPEAAEFYNQFKAENPKTKITYSDVTKILAMIEKSCDDTSQED
jgi:chromosome segregation ATPase